MTPGEVRALEDRICLAYPKLAGPAAAHSRALDVAGLTPYRCPFGHGHWHAEALTLDEMTAMAEMLRERCKPASPLASEIQARYDRAR